MSQKHNRSTKQNTTRLGNGRGYGVLEPSSAAPFQKASDGWPLVLAFGAMDPTGLRFLWTMKSQLAIKTIEKVIRCSGLAGRRPTMQVQIAFGTAGYEMSENKKRDGLENAVHLIQLHDLDAKDQETLIKLSNRAPIAEMCAHKPARESRAQKSPDKRDLNDTTEEENPQPLQQKKD